MMIRSLMKWPQNQVNVTLPAGIETRTRNSIPRKVIEPKIIDCKNRFKDLISDTPLLRKFYPTRFIVPNYLIVTLGGFEGKK